MIRPNPLRQDPTRTKTARRVFERDVLRRFDLLKRAINRLVIEEDSFGLVTNEPWQFLTNDEQLRAFYEWIRTQIGVTILARSFSSLSPEEIWLEEYIAQEYKKGMARAHDAIKKKPMNAEKLAFYQGTRAQFLLSAFGSPASKERVKLLAGRAFNELQGVTDAMAQGMQRTLVDGFIRGESPRTIARALNKEVDGIGKKRARAIAHTEILRAHNEGQLDGMEALGISQVGVMVELHGSGLGSTALGNPSPCPLCAPLVGIVMEISKAKGFLPRHPYCRCTWVPANVGEAPTGQKRTQSRIHTAIKRSLEAERPKRIKRSFAEVKRRSRWAGKDTKVPRKRPKSILDD